MFNDVRRQKAIELIKHQSELPELYHEEKIKLIDKIKDIVAEYNKVVDEIKEVNGRYNDEFDRFVSLYEHFEFYKDKEAKPELINSYSGTNTSSCVIVRDLPYEHRMKLKFRGDK